VTVSVLAELCEKEEISFSVGERERERVLE
jgi:hypothetical protein